MNQKNPMPRNTERRYVTDFEFAIWATKGKWVFNKESNKPYLRPEINTSIPIGKKRLHPTQKSTDLIEQLYKQKRHNIGSGEISICAYNLERNFVASEIDKKYFEISKQRLKNNFIKLAFNHLGNKYRMLD